MTMLDTSNVGVKVGIVARDVIDVVGVAVERDVPVAIGIGEGVVVLLMPGTVVDVPPQADSRKIKMSKPIASPFTRILPG